MQTISGDYFADDEPKWVFCSGGCLCWFFVKNPSGRPVAGELPA